MTAPRKVVAGKRNLADPPDAPQPDGREPTVLDWFLSVLRLKPIPIPAAEAAEVIPIPRRKQAPAMVSPTAEPAVPFSLRAAHLRLPVALLLALIAQASLMKRGEQLWLAILLYLLAAAIAGWALWVRDFDLAVLPDQAAHVGERQIRWSPLAAALVLALLTYLTASGNRFRAATVYFWAASTLLTLWALWLGQPSLPSLWGRIKSWLPAPRISISIGPWSLIVLLGFAVCAYFRLGSLAQVPPEPWSDHAEKTLDIVDVLNGQTSIFFPRNAGREAAQFYITAAAVKWLGAPLNYTTIKTITALAGLFSLPFIYLLGRELWGREVALVGMVLAGVAFWPNVISRVGLRMPFHLLFAAPAMAFLARGLRQGRRNDLILAGLAAGASFYGYSAGRITPLVVLAGFSAYLAHPVARGRRRTLLLWFAMLVGVAAVVAVPFLRTAHDASEDVFYRTVTRVGEAERPLEGPALSIFASNMVKALLMFAWDAGMTHVYSIPFQPILDWITATLFHLGVAMALVGILRLRRWQDWFALLPIPLLLLPSALSLAFPIENPHPGRAGGASIPVFLIAALPLVALSSQLDRAWGRRRLGLGLSALVLLIIAGVNYRLTIVEYGERMRDGSWNVTEAGEVVAGFINSVGNFEHAHVVAYPHWMDTRLVASIAGRPGDDLVLWEDRLAELTPIDQPQLFLLHPEDQANLDTLRSLFPSGRISRYTSRVQGRDFLIYFVPAADEAAVREGSQDLSRTDD